MLGVVRGKGDSGTEVEGSEDEVYAQHNVERQLCRECSNLDKVSKNKCAQLINDRESCKGKLL